MNTWVKVLLSVTMLCCASVGVLGDTVTWDGGGQDGKWFTQANWDMDTLPATGDDVVDSTDEGISYDLGDEGAFDPVIGTFFAKW